MINKKRIAGIFILSLLILFLYIEYASATSCPSFSTGVNAAVCDIDNDTIDELVLENSNMVIGFSNITSIAPLDYLKDKNNNFQFISGMANDRTTYSRGSVLTDNKTSANMTLSLTQANNSFAASINGTGNILLANGTLVTYRINFTLENNTDYVNVSITNITPSIGIYFDLVGRIGNASLDDQYDTGMIKNFSKDALTYQYSSNWKNESGRYIGIKDSSNSLNGIYEDTTGQVYIEPSGSYSLFVWDGYLFDFWNSTRKTNITRGTNYLLDNLPTSGNHDWSSEASAIPVLLNLYYMTENSTYLQNAKTIADDLVAEQQSNGSWTTAMDTTAFVDGKAGIIQAMFDIYLETGNNSYLDSAKKGLGYVLNT